MANKIRFNCTCGKSMSAVLESAGKCMDCPRCGEAMRVPVPAWAGLSDEMVTEDETSQASEKFASARGVALSLAQTPNVKPSRSPANSLWGGDDDFLAQQNLAGKCPMCGANMSGHAVVCLVCGHNKQTKKSTNSELAPLPRRG